MASVTMIAFVALFHWILIGEIALVRERDHQNQAKKRRTEKKKKTCNKKNESTTFLLLINSAFFFDTQSSAMSFQLIVLLYYLICLPFVSSVHWLQCFENIKQKTKFMQPYTLHTKCSWHSTQIKWFIEMIRKKINIKTNEWVIFPLFHPLWWLFYRANAFILLNEKTNYCFKQLV